MILMTEDPKDYASGVRKDVSGHNCKKKQLYVIEVNDDEHTEEGDDTEIIKGNEREEKDLNPHISVHVISGLASKGYRTMRVTVYVRKKPLHILFDLGNTHNFLNSNMAKKLGCKVEKIGPMRVDVANGSSLACIAICKGLNWTLQGSRFTIDVLLLPLGNYDMMLGV